MENEQLHEQLCGCCPPWITLTALSTCQTPSLKWKAEPYQTIGIYFKTVRLKKFIKLFLNFFHDLSHDSEAGFVIHRERVVKTGNSKDIWSCPTQSNTVLWTMFSLITVFQRSLSFTMSNLSFNNILISYFCIMVASSASPIGLGDWWKTTGLLEVLKWRETYQSCKRVLEKRQWNHIILPITEEGSPKVLR